MEETTSKAKEVKASEVTPWYVNQEVDKTVRKDRHPGALRNPSKRRKLLLPKPRVHREMMIKREMMSTYMMKMKVR